MQKTPTAVHRLISDMNFGVKNTLPLLCLNIFVVEFAETVCLIGHKAQF